MAGDRTDPRAASLSAMDLPTLLVEGALDARTAALVWLLLDGGVPLLVVGSAPTSMRAGVASALLALDPVHPWILLDADEEVIDAARLTALLRGGSKVGLTLGAQDLRDVMDRLSSSLPEDAIRRLGTVAVVEDTASGPRCTVVHYLRPTERDAQGHLQRRPPAVLTAWDERGDTFEDYAWGITPELADRVNRAQADLEERLADRARLLRSLSASEDAAGRVRAYLASEPPRVPAPEHGRAQPSPFAGGLTDPEPHPHRH